MRGWEPLDVEHTPLFRAPLRASRSRPAHRLRSGELHEPGSCRARRRAPRTGSVSSPPRHALAAFGWLERMARMTLRVAFRSLRPPVELRAPRGRLRPARDAPSGRRGRSGGGRFHPQRSRSFAARRFSRCVLECPVVGGSWVKGCPGSQRGVCRGTRLEGGPEGVPEGGPEGVRTWPRP